MKTKKQNYEKYHRSQKKRKTPGQSVMKLNSTPQGGATGVEGRPGFIRPKAKTENFLFRDSNKQPIGMTRAERFSPP